MHCFIKHQGIVAPLDQENVDTDAIIPKQFLKSIRRTGFGPNLFDSWRYLDSGFIGQNPDERKENPNFILNKPQYRQASILLTRSNFGCGSSREHASWALLDYGFRVIIAPSFADIFFNNALKNGLLPIICKESHIEKLFAIVDKASKFELLVDLEKQHIFIPSSNQFDNTQTSVESLISFEIDPFQKRCLLEGLDEIGLTLEYSKEISDYETTYLEKFPWLKEIKFHL